MVAPMATELGNGVMDLHAHVVLEGAFGGAGEYGPELGDDDGTPFFRVGDYEMKPSGYRGSVFMDVDKRLAGMDDIGIEMQMLSRNPLTFFGGVEADVATAYARLTNDSMADLVQGQPRLMGSAQVALQDVRGACAEVERAKGLGLVGVYVSTNYGVDFDSPDLDDFYRTMVELDLPLFIHPATNDGRSKAPDERLHRFGLDLIVGYTYEETVVTASLVLGGVFDRHPELDICISHGGGAIGYLVQRFDAMARRRGKSTDFGDKLANLWFDAQMEPGPSRDLLVDLVGTDKMVYGTNFGGWDTPTAADEFDLALTPNARQLLRLDR